MKRLLLASVPALDLVLSPLVYVAAWVMSGVRKAGIQRLPLSRSILSHVGVFPIRSHYYEPQFDAFEGQVAYDTDRLLPGVDWNEDGQLAFLDRLTRADEIRDLPVAPAGEMTFHLNNGAFESGDAECWYQIVREIRPRRIIEIGSGHSTLVARMALARNAADDPDYRCEHICVEPYEMPWLERSGVTVLRRKVEDLDVSFFATLGENDILFIDSSHVIRPAGDVLFEYLQVLPSLNPGVIVHCHDIFSPRNYPREWVQDRVRFWNEQYVLEAFLSHNADWEILLAGNFLRHHHYERLREVAPHLTPDREPGSFYLRRVS